MSVRLTGSHGAWSLPNGSIVIGRARDCQLCIVDPRLSRHHAKIVINGHEVVLHDLESTNGVLLNGDRHHGKKALKNGDLLVAGPCTFFLAIDPSTPLSARIEVLAQQTPGEPGTSVHSDTEAMNPVVDGPEKPAAPAAAATPGTAASRSGEKRLDPAIAALLASGEKHPTTDFLRPHDFTPSGKAVVKTPRSGAATLADTEREGRRPPTHDTLLPDDVRATSTSALSNGTPGSPAPHPYGGASPRDTQSSEHFRPSDYSGENKALQPVPPAVEAGTTVVRKLRWLRLAAGSLDAAQALGIAVALAAAVSMLGYGIALRTADAVIEGGLPRLTVGAHGAAGGAGAAKVRELIATLFHDGGVDRAYQLANELYQLQDQVPFFVLFLAATGTVLVFTLSLLLATVAATVLKGAPTWHRRWGLVIIEHKTGLYLGWGRALARWAFSALLWPASLVLAPLGKRGLHDLVAGCEVRVRKKRS